MKKIAYALICSGLLISSQVFACDYYDIWGDCHDYSGYENYYAN